MEGNFPDILAHGFGSRHEDLNQKADLTLKGSPRTFPQQYTSLLIIKMIGTGLHRANPESKKVHKYTVPDFMLPFKIWILETFPEATQFYIRTPKELPRMRTWRSKTSLSWVRCCRIINVSVPNNQPINVVANPEELMLPFYVCSVNWTLNPVDFPPRQHSPVRNSPPVVASPARRKMYKSEIETSSTESGTNAFLKVGKEEEDEHIKKKDEPDRNVEQDRGFREEEEEEEEEMINEEEEEKYYHDTHLHYDDIGTHSLEVEFGPTPMHVEPSSEVGEHHTKEMTPIVRPQRKRGVPWYQRTPFIVLQSTPKLKKITKAKKNSSGES
ncbi:unnamed protein product [Lactuca virosa]|uniref:Uncharacterized protein n=1 Tax=Lactuca virosa TaxID=75947 RepID=A0AAU9PTJ1_9ASTR|nr:unnamed protein product [Lactuca virosa]